jgi:D-alanyl-D-alanine carboxypeptidase
MSRRILVTPVLVAVVLAAAVFVGIGLPGAGMLPPAGSPAVATSSVGSPGGVVSPAASSSTSSAPRTSGAPSASLVPSTASPAPGSDAGLQAILDLAVRAAGIPGASVTILWPDGRSWTGVSGFADVVARRPVTSDTEFSVASMSKTFLAALILRLVEEGRLALDDRAAPLLPGVKIDARVTIRMLLDHTSGIADFFFGSGVDKALQADRRATWTVARTLGYVGPRSFAPGHGWSSSNTNYLLLGLIAERVGGAPVADQLRARFFDPLRLSGAYVQVAEAALGPLAHGYRFQVPGAKAKPIDVSDGSSIMPFTSVVTAAGAAGNVAATSADLARWARALYGGEVLQPATLAAAVADRTRTAPFHPYVPYGLGVQVTRIGGRLTYGHSGRLLGFRGELRYLPADGVAIAIVTNQNRTDVRPIVTALLAAALGPVASPTPVATPPPTPTTTSAP